MTHPFRRSGRLLMLLAATLIGACSILPEPSRYQLYQLPPSELSPQQAEPGNTSLEVQAPRADDLTSSNRVVVLRKGQRLSAWSDIRWASPAPELWRDRLLDAFHNAGVFQRLGIPEDNLNADFKLTGHLRAFHVDRTEEPPRAVIQFDAQLIDLKARQVVATRRFDAAEPLDGDRPAELARAMGTATDRMAEQLLAWINDEG
ncbi:MAG: ABC-type transport auxiliary lipoprotein family protein [Pseudomonadota bacterium]